MKKELNKLIGKEVVAEIYHEHSYNAKIVGILEKHGIDYEIKIKEDCWVFIRALEVKGITDNNLIIRWKK